MKGDAVLMLELKHIVKTYDLGEERVEALRDVSLSFREHEFVSILGPSGCGKTTAAEYHRRAGSLHERRPRHQRALHQGVQRQRLGRLPQPLDGLCVPELQPHPAPDGAGQCGAGADSVRRVQGRAHRRRAGEALEQVGLGDQMYKKPNQMSGGPDAARRHRPRPGQRPGDSRWPTNRPARWTSDTSVQIMELLKEIARDRLVIMVTHNPELAEHLLHPYHSPEGRAGGGRLRPLPRRGARAGGHRQGSPGRAKDLYVLPHRACRLSLNNLMTKKGRTVLTAFAGSVSASSASP